MKPSVLSLFGDNGHSRICRTWTWTWRIFSIFSIFSSRARQPSSHSKSCAVAVVVSEPERVRQVFHQLNIRVQLLELVRAKCSEYQRLSIIIRHVSTAPPTPTCRIGLEFNRIEGYPRSPQVRKCATAKSWRCGPMRRCSALLVKRRERRSGRSPGDFIL